MTNNIIVLPNFFAYAYKKYAYIPFYLFSKYALLYATGIARMFMEKYALGAAEVIIQITVAPMVSTENIYCYISYKT